MKSKLFFLLLFITSFITAQNKLEIPFDYRNNLINIQVKIGEKNENFIFDTGAMNILTKDFAESQNLTLKKSKYKAKGYIGKTELFETALSHFSPFGKDLQNVEFRVIDWDFVNKLNVAGLIGSEIVRMLGYNILTIDYKNQKLVLSNEKPSNYDYTFNMFKKGYPRIWLGRTNFLIDTGNPLFGESMPNEFMTQSSCNKYSYSSLSFNGNGAKLCEHSVKDLNGKPFIFSQFVFDKARKKVLGNLSLQNFLVQIDFENRKLFLTKNEHYPIPQNIYFIKDDKGIFVAVINEKSEIYKKGVRAGDYLEKIEGLNLSEMKSIADLHRYIMSKDKVNLLIKKSDDSSMDLKEITIR